MLSRRLNKKASIGATITWTVATVIILFVVILFVYATYAISEERKLVNNLELKLSSDSDSGARETLFAILETKINGDAIKDYISRGEYSSIENEVEKITNRIEIKGESFIYLGNKKVMLDDGGLDVG